MGYDPKVWLVGRGQYQLIGDPDDDAATQEAATRRATRLAAELRARKGHHHETPVAVADLPERTGSQTESELGKSDLYPSIPVALTPSERQALTGRVAEQKAMYIVNKHLKDKYGSQVEIEEDRGGADLRVSVGREDGENRGEGD